MNREMETCIGTRTAGLTDDRLYIRTRAGVVADSDPASEQQEAVNKSRALIRAAEESVRFASSRR